jgi:hypothetical protein
MSALPPKADVDWHSPDVRFVPKADGPRDLAAISWPSMHLGRLSKANSVMVLLRDISDARSGVGPDLIGVSGDGDEVGAVFLGTRTHRLYRSADLISVT